MGHASHMTLHLSDFCVKHGIEVIPLYPNATHILQPLDVAVFRPLKTDWRKFLMEWRMDNSGLKLTKVDFPKLFAKALNAISAEVVQSGFIGTSLCPFNPDRIDFKKLILSHNKFDDTPLNSSVTPETSILKNSSGASSVTSMETNLKALENNITPQKLKGFHECSDDTTVPEEHKSLYKVWKRLKNSVDEGVSHDASTSSSSIPVNPGTSLVNLNSNEYDNSDLECFHLLPVTHSTPGVQKTPPKSCPPLPIYLHRSNSHYVGQ